MDVKRRSRHGTSGKNAYVESSLSADQGTPISTQDPARENNPAVSNTSSSTLSPLVRTNMTVPPSPRLPPKSPGKPSATSLSLTPRRVSDLVATPASEPAVTPAGGAARSEAYWEELDLLSSERVLVSGPERPSIVSRYILSSPSMPEVFKSRSAKITSPIFPEFASPCFQKHRVVSNVPEPPPDVRVNPLAGDPEGEAALPPGIIPEIVHEVEFGLYYGFEEAIEVELGYRAMRVPLPYAINVRVVETDGEICPASAKLETNPDCPNSMLLSVISGSVNFESDGEGGGYEDVVLTFWAAPDTASVHNTASLLLTVTDVDGTLYETTLELCAEGTEPMIAVERPRLQSRSNRQDTQITFDKGEGTEEELVTVWNETKHDAPLLINVVVTDSGRGVFSIGRDSDDRCECIPITIPACSAVSFVVRFDLSQVETIRSFYHGTILIKLGCIFPKGVHRWKNRDFNLAFDHVLSMQAKGSDGPCEEVGTPDTTIDLQSQTISEDSTYLYSEDTPMQPASHLRSPAPPKSISTSSSQQTESVPDETPEADIESHPGDVHGTFSVGSEAGTDIVDFEPLDVVISACGLEPVPEGIDQGPLYEGVFSLLEPVEWVLCETSEGLSEETDVQYDYSSTTGNRGSMVSAVSGEDIRGLRRRVNSDNWAHSTKQTQLEESPKPWISSLGTREGPQIASSWTQMAGMNTKQNGGEPENPVHSGLGACKRDHLGQKTVQLLETETHFSPCLNRQAASQLPETTPFGKLVGYVDERACSRVSQNTPFGRLVGYSPDRRRLDSLPSVRKLGFGEGSDYPDEEVFERVSTLRKNGSTGVMGGAAAGLFTAMLGTPPKGIDGMRTGLVHDQPKVPISKAVLSHERTGARCTRSSRNADSDTTASHENVRGGSNVVNPEPLTPQDEISYQVTRSKKTSGKPPLGRRSKGSSTREIELFNVPDQRGSHGTRRNQASLSSFSSALTITGGTSLSAMGAISRDARPKLRLPRKIQKNGVLLVAGAGSVLFPLCSGTKSEMEVEIQVKPAEDSNVCVKAEPSFLVLHSGQRAEVVFSRYSASEGKMNVFLVCRSLKHPEDVTSYRVPLTVESASRISSSKRFSIDRPTLTFYNPDEASREKRFRVFNGTSRREAVQIWIGPREEGEDKDNLGSAFKLLSPAMGFLEPQTSLNVDVFFNGGEETEYHYEDLNIKMGHQVETVRMFGYNGGSEIQMEFTEDKVLRARNVGCRYGFVLITGPEHESEDAFAEKAVLAPGEELEFEMPYGSGSLIYTGDEISRIRFCTALIVDPTRCTDHVEQKKLFSDWFQGQERATAAENLHFTTEKKYTLHYASRMFYLGLQQFSFDVDHERVLPTTASERNREQNWRASMDRDGFVHISNNDPVESLAYEMEGADPKRGVIPPLGDARNAPYRERVTVRSRGVTLELIVPLSGTKRRQY